jgi:hypothetical protein
VPAFVLVSPELVGWVEFDPPPSPPSFKFAPGLNPGGFFVSRNMDGEMEGYKKRTIRFPKSHFIAMNKEFE